MKRYKLTSREFGRGPAHVRTFTTLQALQEACKQQWEGPDYIDGPAQFHSDYCTFRLSGAVLSDLGKRRDSDPARDGYWDWLWHDFTKDTDLSWLPEGGVGIGRRQDRVENDRQREERD